MLNFIIIVFLTLLGAKLVARFLPGSRLMGPIFTIGIFNILGGSLALSSWWETLVSVLLGIFFGLRIDKDIILNFKKIALPLIILVFWYIGLTVLNGNILLNLSSFDKVTSFLSVIPGGLGEVSLMAIDYNADLMTVTSFQILRLITIIVMLPFLVKKFSRKKDQEAERIKIEKKEKNPWKMVFLALFSLLGAFIFHYFNLPAAYLTGSLFFSAFASSFMPDLIQRPPEVINNFAQLGMGAVIGVSFNRESFIAVIDSFAILILITIITVASSFLLAYIFNKIFKWDYLTCFLGVVPGGIAPIMVLSDQIDIDIALVAIMQIVRLITAIMIIPFLYILIL